jgi:hypothetical protein
MSQQKLKDIQYTILIGEYELSEHAYEEMDADYLTVFDVENALLSGKITKTVRDDKPGPRYTIKGFAEDNKTEVAVVGRFGNTGVYIIITVYEITD